MGFAPGPGGGSSSIAGSTDVSLNNPQTNQFLGYNGTSSKWINQAVPGGGSGGGGTLITVAASNAPDIIKARADYVCAGSNDQNTINQALDVSTGSQYYTGVQLSVGTYRITSAILVPSGALLEGSGWLTELRSVNNNTTNTGIGSGAAVIKARDIGARAIHIRSLGINGGYASGGAAHGIFISQDGTVNSMLGDWVNTSPDNYHVIDDIHMIGLNGAANRHGVYFDGRNGNARGNWLSRCSIRNTSGHGVYIESYSDCTVTDCHVSAGQDGFRIAGGSTRLVGNKAFYCDNYGFNMTSSRVHLTGNETQDCATGLYIGSPNFSVTGQIVDTSRDDGIILAASNGVLEANIYTRQHRYDTQLRGMSIRQGAGSNKVDLVIDPSNIGTPLVHNGTTITTANQASLPSSYYRVVVGENVISKG